jgi:hypothetical protein
MFRSSYVAQTIPLKLSVNRVLLDGYREPPEAPGGLAVPIEPTNQPGSQSLRPASKPFRVFAPQATVALQHDCTNNQAGRQILRPADIVVGSDCLLHGPGRSTNCFRKHSCGFRGPTGDLPGPNGPLHRRGHVALMCESNCFLRFCDPSSAEPGSQKRKNNKIHTSKRHAPGHEMDRWAPGGLR